MPNIKQVSFTGPYAEEEADILRRQRMAEMLQGEARTPLQTNRMAGRVVIPISPWEGAAKLAQGAMGGYQAEQAKAMARKLGERRQGDRTADMGALAAMLRGQPASPSPADELGGGPGMPARPGGQIDPAMLGQLKSPEMQNMAMQMYMEQMKDANRNPLDMVGKINPKDYTPESFASFMATKNPNALRPVTEYAEVGGNLVPKPQGTIPVGGLQPVYTAPQKPDELTAALTAAGINPKSPEAQALFKARASKIATHQPAANMNVAVSTDKGYLGHVASGLAGQDVAAIDAAKGGPQRIESARRVKTLLDSGAITGTAAEWRTSAQKALVTAGIMDGKTVATTEQLGSSLASQTLDAIKTSGLGSGQGFTDKDRQFLEKAKAGTLDMNRESLRALADLNERAAVASIKRGNEVIKKLKSSKLSGEMGAGLQEISAPADPNSPVPVPLSPATREFLKKQGIAVD